MFNHVARVSYWEDHAPAGTKPFRYRWSRAGGGSGVKTVYVNSAEDGRRLVAEWNRLGQGTWTYEVLQ